MAQGGAMAGWVMCSMWALAAFGSSANLDVPSLLTQQRQTSHFHYYFPEDLSQAASELAGQAEGWSAKILGDLGIDFSDQTVVYLVRQQSHMARVTPIGTQVPDWAVGLAFSQLRLILLCVFDNQGGAVDLRRAFLHEWAHLALDRSVSGNNLPRWFREGFAMVESEEWSFGRSAALAGGVISGRLFSLQSLSEDFPDSLQDAELAYAQSIDFVGFLLSQYGQPSFHRLIGMLTQGRSFWTAVEDAFDKSVLEIETEWRSDLKRRFTWVSVLTGATVFWFLGTLVFIWAYAKKRRAKRAALEQMEDDAPLPKLDDPEQAPPGGWLQ